MQNTADSDFEDTEHYHSSKLKKNLICALRFDVFSVNNSRGAEWNFSQSLNEISEEE